VLRKFNPHTSLSPENGIFEREVWIFIEFYLSLSRSTVVKGLLLRLWVLIASPAVPVYWENLIRNKSDSLATLKVLF